MKKEKQLMKKSLITLLAASSLMASAGIAAADTAGAIALYGSSAQAAYWNAQAATWLTGQAANGGMGCTHATTATAVKVPSTSSASYAGTTHYQIVGTGCTNPDALAVASNGTLTVLYTANDSVTGIQSVAGAINADGCPSANQRVMYPATGVINCQTVHVGVADVAGESIVQTSSGNKFGPMGGPAVNPNYTAAAYPPNGGLNTAAMGLSYINPGFNGTLATPFGFFANKGVTATQCTSGLIGSYCGTPLDNSPNNAITGNSNSDYLTTGNQTAINHQCDTAYGSNDGTCGPAAPITNISRLEAALLFSGKIANWNNLGTYFTPQPVTLCMRQAGSGTQATFDWAVMRAGGTGWGATALTNQKVSANGLSVYFNQASADMANCINGETSANGGTPTVMGAIGFMDADTVVGTSASNLDVVRLAYQGVYPTRYAVRNGLYDFYALAWFYMTQANYTGDSNNQAPVTAIGQLASDMITFAQDPDNMAPAKANYWATQLEMNVVKGTDQSYPAATVVAWPMQP